MDLFWFGFFFAAMFGLQFVLSWLDNKHGLKLVDWCNGEVSSPFSPSSSPENGRGNESRSELSHIKERIQVLEKIVTDDAYELNQEFKKLTS